MPGTTPNRNYPFPLVGEPPEGDLNMQALAMALDNDVDNLTDTIKQGVPSYASAAERDAANPTPSPGNMAYRSDRGWFEYWTGAIWQPFAGNLPQITLEFNPASNITTTPDGARFTIPVASIPVDTVPGFYTVNMSEGSITLTTPGTYGIRAGFMSQGLDTQPRTIGVDIGDLTRSIVPGIYAYTAPTPGFPTGRASISISGEAKFTAGQVIAMWHAGDLPFDTLGSGLRITMIGA